MAPELVYCVAKISALRTTSKKTETFKTKLS